MASVTFETKCWANDWEIILKTDYLQQCIERNRYVFDEKLLLINNVNSYEDVVPYANRLVDSGIITSFHIVEEYAARVLEFFQLSAQALGKGYYYSIAELTAIYLCRTDYLLHFASDAVLEDYIDWIPEATGVLSRDPSVKVVNPCWNRRYAEAKTEAVREDDRFTYGYGFSDQCYLIGRSDFTAPIYNFSCPESERYPEYGGELFEKRVDAWMRNRNYLRATCKFCSYLHPLQGTIRTGG